MALLRKGRQDHFINTCLGLCYDGIHFLHVRFLDEIFLNLGGFQIVYHVFETSGAFITSCVEFLWLTLNFLRVKLCKSCNLFFKELYFILESIFNFSVFITSLEATLLGLT